MCPHDSSWTGGVDSDRAKRRSEDGVVELNKKPPLRVNNRGFSIIYRGLAASFHQNFR